MDFDSFTSPFPPITCFQSQPSDFQAFSSLHLMESDASLNSSFHSSYSLSIDEGKLENPLMHRCLDTITGHVGLVSSIVLSGDHLYTASQGTDIRMWRQTDFLQCSRFGGGEGAVKAIVVAGEKVFSAHQDHKIRVWKRSRSQPACHKHVATLPTAKDYLINCVFPKNYVQVRRHHKKLWIEHADTISVLAIGKSNKLLYSGSWDKTVKIWRLSDLKCLESIPAHDDAVNALVVSPDRYLYTASADSKVKVWTKKSKDKKHSLVATLEGHKSSVNALALSADAEHLYSGGSESAITVWERVQDGAHNHHMSLMCKLKGHRQSILCLCTQGNLLLSGSADKEVRAWRRGVDNHLSCVAILRGHTGPVKSISVAGELVGGCLVYSGSSDKSIKVWWLSSELQGTHCRSDLLY